MITDDPQIIKLVDEFLERTSRPTGRQEGYEVPDSSGIKGSNSHFWAGYCHTPDGKFESMVEAARHYNMSHAGVSYRVKSTNFPDWYVTEKK